MLVALASATVIVAASLGMVYCVIVDRRCARRYRRLLALLMAQDADRPSGSVPP